MKTWPDSSTIRFCYISQYMTIIHFHEILCNRWIQEERKRNDWQRLQYVKCHIMKQERKSFGKNWKTYDKKNFFYWTPTERQGPQHGEYYSYLGCKIFWFYWEDNNVWDKKNLPSFQGITFQKTITFTFTAT